MLDSCPSFYFSYADARIAADLPLTGLPRHDGSDVATLSILSRRSRARAHLNSEGQGAAIDVQALDTPGFDFTKVGSAISLCVPGLGQFVVEQNGREISVFLEASYSDSTLNHWLVDHLLPRVLAHQGQLVLHAAAVHATPGSAIAFLGDTGAGKSTLTASLHDAGHLLLSDDALVLNCAQGTVTALPTYPSLRLWPDAVARVYQQTPPVAPMARDSSKQCVLIDAPTESRGQPVPLSALYLLGAESDSSGRQTSLTRLSGQETCMAIIGNAFQLDLTDTCRAAHLMKAAAEVARRVPAFKLSYPRDFDRLPEVRAMIIEHSRGMTAIAVDAAEAG